MAVFLVGGGEGAEAGGELAHGAEGGVVGHGLRGEGPDVAEGHGAEAFGDFAVAGADGGGDVDEGGAVDGDAAEFVGEAVADVLEGDLDIFDADVGGLIRFGQERGGGEEEAAGEIRHWNIS